MRPSLRSPSKGAYLDTTTMGSANSLAPRSLGEGQGEGSVSSNSAVPGCNPLQTPILKYENARNDRRPAAVHFAGLDLGHPPRLPAVKLDTPRLALFACLRPENRVSSLTEQDNRYED
jgi:hypothetical protein